MRGDTFTVVSPAFTGQRTGVTFSLGDTGLGGVRAFRPPPARFGRVLQKRGLLRGDRLLRFRGLGNYPRGFSVVFGKLLPSFYRTVILLLVGLRRTLKNGKR